MRGIWIMTGFFAAQCGIIGFTIGLGAYWAIPPAAIPAIIGGWLLHGVIRDEIRFSREFGAQLARLERAAAESKA